MAHWIDWLYDLLADFPLRALSKRQGRACLSAGVACTLLCCGLAPAISLGASAAPPAREAAGRRETGRYTGLPVPRFAALRSDRVNLRRGPGRRYRIDWVLRRRLLPVEILREFRDWRFVRISDGTRGWVHRALLVGRRSFVIDDSTTALRHAPRRGARVVALLKPGVIGRLVSCGPGSGWCRAAVAGHTGYLKRTAFWGTLPNEAIAD